MLQNQSARFFCNTDFVTMQSIWFSEVYTAKITSLQNYTFFGQNWRRLIEHGRSEVPLLIIKVGTFLMDSPLSHCWCSLDDCLTALLFQRAMIWGGYPHTCPSIATPRLFAAPAWHTLPKRDALIPLPLCRVPRHAVPRVPILEQHSGNFLLMLRSPYATGWQDTPFTSTTSASPWNVWLSTAHSPIFS